MNERVEKCLRTVRTIQTSNDQREFRDLQINNATNKKKFVTSKWFNENVPMCKYLTLG